MTRGFVLALALCGASTVLSPPTGEAQELSAVGGALAGAGAGVWLGVAYITLQARQGDFVDSEEEAAGMAALPLFGGLASGLALGVFGDDRMGETLAWSGVGWAAGVGVGAVVGNYVWDDPSRRWAGAVIGGAAGLIVGGVTGLILSDADEPSGAVNGVPLMIRLPF